jgi:hypothetical protein
MPVIVISPKYLNELKKLPDDVLSFDGAIEEVRVRPFMFPITTPRPPQKKRQQKN